MLAGRALAKDWAHHLARQVDRHEEVACSHVLSDCPEMPLSLPSTLAFLEKEELHLTD
jgi:hypothetical protein